MNKELIIKTSSEAVDFALLRDGKLIELHREASENSFSVGDIFLAKVRKPVSGLNAAFVNVGHQKDAFLHYHDLGPQFNSLMKFTKALLQKKTSNYSLANFSLEEEIDKEGSISDVIKANQSILVQIVKEPISTKGPRISSELSLAGRYVVMVPFSDRISVSQKIESSEEKSRLKRLVTSIRPKGFGIIIRTVAEGKKVAELDQDIKRLVKKWETLCDNVSKGHHPSKVLVELNRSTSYLRDVFNESFTGIHTDDPEMADQIREYLSQISPKHESLIKLHTEVTPIYEKFGIDRQIKTSFGRTASMSKGAYLVIEHTEAMHVIDVNSGNRSNRANSQEDTALEVNLIAASEVARQLRLRDMGGIIVVDFIDMGKGEHRKKLYDQLKEEMNDDRAKHKILPPTKFGLIQITRQRVRPEMNITTTEKNPNAVEDAVEAPISIIDKLEYQIERIALKKVKEKVFLHIHPFIAAYLTKGLFSFRYKWYKKHKVWVSVIPRDAYTYLQYNFKTKEGKTIRL